MKTTKFPLHSLLVMGLIVLTTFNSAFAQPPAPTATPRKVETEATTQPVVRPHVWITSPIEPSYYRSTAAPTPIPVPTVGTGTPVPTPIPTATPFPGPTPCWRLPVKAGQPRHSVMYWERSQEEWFFSLPVGGDVDVEDAPSTNPNLLYPYNRSDGFWAHAANFFSPQYTWDYTGNGTQISTFLGGWGTPPIIDWIHADSTTNTPEDHSAARALILFKDYEGDPDMASHLAIGTQAGTVKVTVQEGTTGITSIGRYSIIWHQPAENVKEDTTKLKQDAWLLPIEPSEYDSHTIATPDPDSGIGTFFPATFKVPGTDPYSYLVQDLAQTSGQELQVLSNAAGDAGVLVNILGLGLSNVQITSNINGVTNTWSAFEHAQTLTDTGIMNCVPLGGTYERCVMVKPLLCQHFDAHYLTFDAYAFHGFMGVRHSWELRSSGPPQPAGVYQIYVGGGGNSGTETP